MGTGAENSNMPLIPDSRPILDRLKLEVAEDLHLTKFVEAKMKNGYCGHLTSRDNGAVGGHMVKRMVKAAKDALGEL